jgi:tRNA A37 threonylcarbamoyladenosine modification protein TsaB
VKWLAIETSSPRVSLACGEGEAVAREAAAEGEASALLEGLFRELAPDLGAVGACFLGRGPGSYNGLRVGYAFLKGLFCTRPVPVAEVPTPILLAAQVADARLGGEGRVLVVNNARRGELRGTMVLAAEGRLSVEWEFTGEGTALRARLGPAPSAIATWDFAPSDLAGLGGAPCWREFPRAASLAAAAGRAGLVPAADLSRLEPAYVRPPVVAPSGPAPKHQRKAPEHKTPAGGRGEDGGE